MERRHFLKSGTLAGASLMLPGLVNGISRWAEYHHRSERSLVMIQLCGGNDGLNTVIPFRDDDYYRFRGTTALRPHQVLRLQDDLGLHPSLTGLHALFGEGQLTVINNVGSHNLGSLHGRASEYWWRAIDDALYAVFDPVDPLRTKLEYGRVEDRIDRGGPNKSVQRKRSHYPPLGRQLKQVADDLIHGNASQVYRVCLAGFDTHMHQLEQHAHQLAIYDKALRGFMCKLAKHGKQQDVLVMTFSEFGRSASENNSRGTDHGNGGTMLLAGGGLEGARLLGQQSFSGYQGNRVQFDYGNVIQEVVTNWMGIGAQNEQSMRLFS